MAPTNEKVSSHIPEDIFFSILSKLPLKSLNRFSCVCKSWTLLFEDPYFMNMFGKNMVSKYHALYDETDLLLNHPDDIDCQWKLYLLSDEKFGSKVQLNWPRPFSGNQNNGASCPHIVGSAINGILCIYDAENPSTIVLWNPVTEELNRVPQSRAILYHENPVTEELNRVPQSRAILYHEFETCFDIHGFGYDHVNDDYKIIQRVVYSLKDNSWKKIHADLQQPYLLRHVEPSGPSWELYSLKNNSWKKINADMRQRYLMSHEDVEVYLNGVCYWWGKRDLETYVVSFNLSNEMHLTTLFPLSFHDLTWVERNFALLNGHVAMILSYEKKSTSSFHISISVLGEPGVAESWTKLFEVNPIPSGIEQPIGSGKKGDVFFSNEDDELVCLDLSTGVVENIGVKEGFHSQVVVYKKNLVSFGGINN